MSVLQSLVVSIAMWHNDLTGGKSQASSESFTIVKPCRPNCEAVRAFLQEYNHQKDISERLMDIDDADVEEMKDSEADETSAADDDDANMMCDEDLKQEPPDHIKLVMEVLCYILYVFMCLNKFIG